MCSSLVCAEKSHLEMIPVILKQLDSMSITQKQNYFSLAELPRGVQDLMDDTMGKTQSEW